MFGSFAFDCDIVPQLSKMLSNLNKQNQFMVSIANLVPLKSR